MAYFFPAKKKEEPTNAYSQEPAKVEKYQESYVETKEEPKEEGYSFE